MQAPNVLTVILSISCTLFFVKLFSLVSYPMLMQPKMAETVFIASRIYVCLVNTVAATTKTILPLSNGYTTPMTVCVLMIHLFLIF